MNVLSLLSYLCVPLLIPLFIPFFVVPFSTYSYMFRYAHFSLLSSLFTFKAESLSSLPQLVVPIYLFACTHSLILENSLHEISLTFSIKSFLSIHSCSHSRSFWYIHSLSISVLLSHTSFLKHFHSTYTCHSFFSMSFYLHLFLTRSWCHEPILG